MRPTASCTQLKEEGQALLEKGAFQEALVALRAACAQDPQDAEAWYLLAGAQGRTGAFADAEASCRRAVALNPGFAIAHYRLANALDAQGHHEEALGSYRRALELEPGLAQAWNNLGVALMALTRPDEAEQAYRRALALATGDPDIHTNLALALIGQNRVRESLAPLAAALEIGPEHVEAHWTLALAWLLLGELERGWALYDWRWRRPGKALPDVSKPLWDGGPLQGKTILLHHEQGFGDTVQFLRYLPRLKAMGATTVVRCQAPLKRLLTTARGIDRLVSDVDPVPAFDVHLPLGSLPGRLGTTLGSIPARVSYLDVPQGAGSRVCEVIRSHRAARKVGVVWAGNPAHANDRNRSCPAVLFRPLTGLGDVAVFSLQKGHGRLPDPAYAELGITDLAPLLEDFADTAAAIRALDLVVTVDTSVAHLAGALGHPVWVLLAFAPDWRWMLERADSPWYPTMRLFRQPHWGDWDTVGHQVVAALRHLSPIPG